MFPRKAQSSKSATHRRLRPTHTVGIILASLARAHPTSTDKTEVEDIKGEGRSLPNRSYGFVSSLSTTLSSTRDLAYGSDSHHLQKFDFAFLLVRADGDSKKGKWGICSGFFFLCFLFCFLPTTFAHGRFVLPFHTWTLASLSNWASCALRTSPELDLGGCTVDCEATWSLGFVWEEPDRLRVVLSCLAGGSRGGFCIFLDSRYISKAYFNNPCLVTVRVK